MNIEIQRVKTPEGHLWVYAPAPWNASVQMQFHKYQTGEYEQWIRGRLASGEYDVFIDVGAAFGYHTVFGAKHCRDVLAYEASPFRFGVLLTNALRLKNAILACYFVGAKDMPGKAPINAWRPVEQPMGESDAIPTQQLDNLEDYLHDAKKVLVKIDVEGNELAVLDGATALLKDKRIEWIIEVHHIFDVKAEDVTSRMEGLTSELIPRTAMGLQPDASGRRARFFYFKHDSEEAAE